MLRTEERDEINSNTFSEPVGRAAQASVNPRGVGDESHAPVGELRLTLGEEDVEAGACREPLGRSRIRGAVPTNWTGSNRLARSSLEGTDADTAEEVALEEQEEDDHRHGGDRCTCHDETVVGGELPCNVATPTGSV